MTLDMCPAPFITSRDIWSNPDKTVNVDILMPNGILITLNVDKETTFVEIKEDAFEESQKHPLFGALRDKQNYIFTYISISCSEQQEIVDEELRLCDICPFLALLRLIERKGDKAEIQLDAQIGLLIGKSLREFDSLKNPEVNEFRFKMRNYSDEVTQERKHKSWIEKMKYQYPIGIECADIQQCKYLKDKLSDGCIKVFVAFQNTSFCNEFVVPYTVLPKELISLALSKDPEAYGSPQAYLLKIVGRLEYLLEDYQLIQYKPMRDMIVNGVIPTLVTVLKTNIEFEDEPIYSMPDIECRSRSLSVISLSGTTRIRKTPISSWTIERKLVIHINGAQRINMYESSKISLMAGLFHGGESLCDTITISTIIPNENGDGVWEEDICFNIKICDIPRMARLCFAMFAVGQSKKGAKTKTKPLAWANTNMFDYKNVLKVGSITLSMWKYDEDFEQFDTEFFNPLGTVVPNPSVDQATCLTITFNKYSEGEIPIAYPSSHEITREVFLGKSLNNMMEEESETNESNTTRRSRHASKQFLEQLKEICDRDLLHKMSEQDRELLWFLKEDCRTLLPHSLNKLLISFKWNNHKMVAEVLSLLQEWPKLKPEQALELLDYAYADSMVRKFAVECLKEFSDDDLSLYLLQLVQALKYESYIYCDLVHFLLERAFNNQRIGHCLFWLLRSEMHEPAVAVYFGLILETYCRGAMDHMQILSRQTEALNKLKRVNEIIHFDNNKNRDSRDKKICLMHEIIAQKYYQETLLDIVNPLDPVYKLGSIKINKCKFMDSKMKPLWLVFQNEDEGAKDIYLIFKNGDDLRQDMLTLQMIRIMDKLWKDDGLDLRMNPYRCISTDQKVGMIEVVLNADTIANIQKEKASSAISSAFKKGSLLEWLRDENQSEQQLNKAIEEFTLSCAGYCVATYILGIADRHNDNIMVKKNGQLFHIDFGHILGNYKEKFGIRRERVPFVLTHDFVSVITHGQNQQKSEDFNRFQQYCEDAFMIIRKRGAFIISLFAMMLSTGIPELSSVNDLDYLRETLVLDLTEDQARSHFKSKFTEALKNSWKTSLNWFAHNIAKDNKMAD